MTPRRLVVAFALAVAVGAAWWGVRSRRVQTMRGVPHARSAALKPAPPRDAIGPFYVGISSLDVEEDEIAGRLFDQLSKEIPTEPAVWANLGLARLRLGDLAGAKTALATAAKLAPSDDRIAILQASVDENQGRYAEAIRRLEALPHPGDAVLYRLAGLLARTGRAADAQRQLDVLDRLCRSAPENVVAAFERARLLARLHESPRLERALATFETHHVGWSPSAMRQLAELESAAAAGNFRRVATNLTFLQNTLASTPPYRAALALLDANGGAIGRPIRDFLTFRTPETVAAPADAGLTFDLQPDAAAGLRPTLFLALALDADPGSTLLTVARGALRLSRGGQLSTNVPAAAGPNSICAADFNGSGLLDLVLATHDGLKIWMQNEPGRFTPFHPKADLEKAFAQPAHGVWPLDFDADGDLDLLVARDGTSPLLLRNNGDGTFKALATFADFPDIRQACWGDWDGDGNGDLAFIDNTGRVQISWNHRSGAFTPPATVSATPAAALAAGDLLGSGDLGLIVFDRSGTIRELAFDRVKRSWSSHELARWSDVPAFSAGIRANLLVGDLDNNGAPDVVASAGDATAIWLNQGSGRLDRLRRAPGLFVTSVADLDGDGMLDLVGMTATGAAVAHGRGTKGYHWQAIQARARASAEDGRINSYGIGGRIEIRAGPLLEMAPIASTTTRFGLGDNPQVGVARIVWPNGVAQVEFALEPNKLVTATQRLKGSCPWVFADDGGGRFQFVKDFIWRSPLGMRINSQDTAGVDQTADWILVPGSVLRPDRGAYRLRITAELWETHFFDHVALAVVDHPKSVATFVDERFVPMRQPKLAVIATTPPQPFADVHDQSGRDMRAALAESDGLYAADFPLGRYQGLVPEHWIEFRLPDEIPPGRRILLVGEGWIYPTDSSLNVAISQGHQPRPHGLVLEDYDPTQGWRPVSGDLGFPAGKNKTVVIPLPRAALQSGHRKFRLRTNLEIYWDRLGWAVAMPGAPLRIASTATTSAVLRYRGFSALPPPQRRRPDIPVYARLAGAGPRWQDLEGYYTRYGDIRELLERTDDRYVIMNAGDEIELRFAVPPPPPAGWTRDFVLIGDGWVKDGDFNTANSRTVQPLPYHGMTRYASAPETLANDPVYRRHRDDWRRFHTRYVSPADFERGMMHVAAGDSR